jgi:hypothetical protein
MTTLRGIWAAVMSRGVISTGWYAVLTGVALLVVAYLMAFATDSDRAAPYVAVALAVAGVWQLERGIRLQTRNRAGKD